MAGGGGSGAAARSRRTGACGRGRLGVGLAARRSPSCVAGLVAPPPATAQRVDRDRELRPLYDPNLGMDESGRIPKVPLPQDLPSPTRWRYIPEGRIMPGNAFERLFVSSFISPQIFFREDVGLGGGIAHHRHRLPGAAAPRVPRRLRHVHDRGPGAVSPGLAALALSPGDSGRRRRRGGAQLSGRRGRLLPDPHAALLRARPRHRAERRVELHGRGLGRGLPRGACPARARGRLDRDRRSPRRASQPRPRPGLGSAQHRRRLPGPLRRRRRRDRDVPERWESATTPATASTSRTAGGAWAWSPT